MSTLAEKMENFAGMPLSECWAAFSISEVEVLRRVGLFDKCQQMRGVANMDQCMMVNAQEITPEISTQLEGIGLAALNTTEIAGIFSIRREARKAEGEEDSLDREAKQALANQGLLDWFGKTPRGEITELAHQAQLGKYANGRLLVATPPDKRVRIRNSSDFWILLSTAPVNYRSKAVTKLNGVDLPANIGQVLNCKADLDLDVHDVVESTEGTPIAVLEDLSKLFILWCPEAAESKEEKNVAADILRYIFKKAGEILKSKENWISLKEVMKYVRSSQGDRSRAIRDEFEEALRNRDEKRRQLAEAARLLQEKSVSLACINDSSDDDARAKFIVDGLRKMPIKILSLKGGNEGSISFITEPMVIMHSPRLPDQKTKRAVPQARAVGKFNVKLGHNGHVEFRNIGGYVRASGGETWDHPHVRMGNPCLGNIRDQLPELVRTGRLIDAIVMCLEYLRSVNDSDPWGQHITSWPLLDRVQKEFDAALATQKRLDITRIPSEKCNPFKNEKGEPIELPLLKEPVAVEE